MWEEGAKYMKMAADNGGDVCAFTYSLIALTGEGIPINKNGHQS